MPYAKGGRAERFARRRKSFIGRADTIERQIARGQYSISEIPTMKAQADYYRLQAAQLYTTERINGKRFMKSEIELQRLERQAETVASNFVNLRSKKGRSIYFMQSQINRAGTPLSSYTEEEVSKFYRLTQDLWEGKKGNRNIIIMEELGTTDLEATFEAVLAAGEEYIYSKTSNGSVTVSNEKGPEMQEPEGANDKHGYADDFVGFDISNYSRLIRETANELTPIFEEVD